MSTILGTALGVAIGLTSRGLSSAIRSDFALWLYGTVPRDIYITDKHGQQDRELLSGEIFPGRGYEGDQTNYITLDSDILFADNTSWAVSCFVEWDVMAQEDGIFSNQFTPTNYTKFWKGDDGLYYGFTNEANDFISWVVTIPTVRHHVLIQCDGTDSDNLELFIDGVSKGTRTLADTEIVIYELMSIGGGGNSALDGIIEDFRVYERILDSTEIAALQTKDALGGELLWYPCEDVDLLTAFDASGNENHGTKVSWLGANHVEGAWQNLMNKYGYNGGVTGPSLMDAGAGDFDVDTESWTKYGNNTIENDNGTLKTTYVDNQFGAYQRLRSANDLGVDLIIGQTYKIRAKCKVNTGSVSLGVYTDSFITIAIITATDFTWYEGTFIATRTTDDELMFSGMDSSEIVWIDEWNIAEYYADEVPADMSTATPPAYANPSLDCLGNDLVYAGQAQYHGLSVDAGSFIGDGSAYFTVTGLLTTDTIEVETGSDTPTCTSDNRLDIADGDEVYGVTIKRASVVWAIIPFCEEVGITAYDVSGNGNHATGVSVDETNWGTQDDFHYIRDYGMSQKLMDVSKGSFDVDTESWTVYGTNTIVNDNDALKITYVDNASGAKTELQVTGDIVTDLLIGTAYKVRVKIKINSGSVNIVIYDGAGNITSSSITNTTYEWVEISFVAKHATNCIMRMWNMSGGEIIWIDEWYIELVDGFIPALADKSADALGGVIQYPQSGANAIPDTYFKLPENIGELIAADLDGRYMNIMDAGKGVFTEIITDDVTNGGFDTDSDWTKESGWEISGGTANATASIFTIYQSGLTIGKIYKITFTISDYDSGSVKSRAGNTSGATHTGNGTYSDVLLCSVSGNVYIDGVSAFTGKIDNVSAVEQNVESWEGYVSNVIENDNGVLKITYVDNQGGAYVFLKEAGDTDTDLTVGKTYKVSARCKVNAGTSAKLYISGPNVNITDSITDTEFAWYEGTFVATHATTNRFQIALMDAGEIIWIDQWSIHEQILSTGNNFITDGEGFKWRDDDSDGMGNGWLQPTGTGTLSIVTGNGFVGNAQRIEHITATMTRVQYATGITAVIGQTYQVTGKFRAGAVNWKIFLRAASDSFTSNMGANTGDAIAFSYTVEATAATEIIVSFYKFSDEANDYIEVDEVEVRPVIPSFFYEPLVLGLAPVVIKTNNIPDYRYLTQYYNSTNRKDLILLKAGHSLDGGDHNTLLKFTKNN